MEFVDGCGGGGGGGVDGYDGCDGWLLESGLPSECDRDKADIRAVRARLESEKSEYEP